MRPADRLASFDPALFDRDHSVGGTSPEQVHIAISRLLTEIVYVATYQDLGLGKDRNTSSKPLQEYGTPVTT
jgi:hypothetical protein